MQIKFVPEYVTVDLKAVVDHTVSGHHQTDSSYGGSVGLRCNFNGIEHYREWDRGHLGLLAESGADCGVAFVRVERGRTGRSHRRQSLAGVLRWRWM